MSQLNVDNIQNRTGSGGGPNFPSGITVAVGQTAYIHGNLQVDGTETIVNTETLNVADKTVGIGSTSNASNTTADGSGIEVFASSSQTGNNKTITWQNSSSAWTFAGGGIVATDAVVGSAVTINSSGIKAGIITATTFAGNLTGDVTGDVTGSGANLTNLPSGELTGALPAISGANLTGIDAAPTYKATASGALAAGDKVIINSNGTVTKAKETYSAVSPIGGMSTGDVNIPNNSDPTSEWRTCKIKDNYMLAAYKNNSLRGKQIYIADGGAATVSSNELPISGGGAANIIDVAHDPVRNQAVILYVKNDNKLYVRNIRSTGTSTLTYGNEVNVSNTAGWDVSGEYQSCISYDTAASKFLIVHVKDVETSNHCTAQTMTVVDNDNFTFGSRVTFRSSQCAFGAVAYDSTAGKHLILYRDNAISDDAYGIVATVSGTSVSFGTAVALETGDNRYPKLAYSTTDNKFLWVSSDETTNKLDLSALTISGTSVSRGAVTEVSVTNINANTDDTIANAYDPTLDKFYIVYRNNSVGKMVPATLSGTSVTAGTETNSRLGNGVEDQDLAYDSGSNRFLFVLQNGATDAGLYQIWKTSNAATNLTEENYIGISRSSVADTNEATIDVSGATNISQSGLTAGQNYYVQNNGTLGLAAANPRVLAGTAVSGDKLLIAGPSPTPPGCVWVESKVAPNSNTVDFTWPESAAGVSMYKIIWSGVTHYGGASRHLRARIQCNGSWHTGSHYINRPSLREFNSNGGETYPNYTDDYYRVSANESGNVSFGELSIPMTVNDTDSGEGNKYMWSHCVTGNYIINGECQFTNAVIRTNPITGIQFYNSYGEPEGVAGRFDLYKYTY